MGGPARRWRKCNALEGIKASKTKMDIASNISVRVYESYHQDPI